MSLRPNLPRFNIGQPITAPLIGRTQAEGGRVYYVRWGATTAQDFGLDSRGQGVHARITRTALGEACGVSEVPGTSIDTDFGNHAVYLAAGEPIPLMMPAWDVDFDRGIYIPHGITAQIDLVGGDPASTAIAFPTFHSRLLKPWEEPPPLRTTYQNAPVRQEVILTDLLVGTEIQPSDLRGAVTVSCPENRTPALQVELFYNGALTDARTIPAFPGVPISLAGAWKCRFTDGGHWEFRVEL